MDFDRPIIVIAGPTASGKSSLALKLAKDINGTIINADSRQIYKELNIGTAKPTPDTVDNDTWYIDDIPHLLYGFKSIKDSYNIFEYQKDVQRVLENLPEDTIPILTGGTGLYIDSVVFNYQLEDNSKQKEACENDAIRKELEKMNIFQLQNLLDKDVLEELNNSDRNNPVRLIRMIEKKDGKDISKGTPLNHTYFVIDKDKKELKERIAKRAAQMLDTSLIEENRELFDKGLFGNKVVQKTIGYQEFNGYFEKEKSLEEVKDEIINNTNRYAKRQKTWFRRNKNCIWTNNYEDILERSRSFIKTS